MPNYGQVGHSYAQQPSYGQQPQPSYYGSQPSYGWQDSFAQPHNLGQPYPGYGQQPGYYQPNPGQFQPGYGQLQPAGYAQRPVYGQYTMPGSNLALNYWLSALFGWLPALIFYLVDKDKAPLLDYHIKENLNFQLTRLLVIMVTYILGIVTLVLLLAVFVVVIGAFVIAVIAAINGPREFAAGRPYRIPLTIRFIK